MAWNGRKIAVRNSAPQPAEARAPEVKPEVKTEVAADVKSEVVLPPPATLEVARAEAPAPGMASDKPGEIRKAESALPDDQDNMVAIVLTRPEINSLSDLNNKNIAITEKQSASSGRVSAALMAAGAAEVQFSEVEASAIDRLMSGEVPAAVVLASRDVANLFPELDGFRTFRVPLNARM
jgi:ABC-type phosphate/phosphonate transport system substrate-binding protein